MQAKFIRDAYAVHMKERREAGFQRPRRGAVEKIAKIFGIAPNYVHMIARRKRWRHIR